MVELQPSPAAPRSNQPVCGRLPERPTWRAGSRPRIAGKTSVAAGDLGRQVMHGAHDLAHDLVRPLSHDDHEPIAARNLAPSSSDRSSITISSWGGSGRARRNSSSTGSSNCCSPARSESSFDTRSEPIAWGGRDALTPVRDTQDAKRGRRERTTRGQRCLEPVLPLSRVSPTIGLGRIGCGCGCGVGLSAIDDILRLVDQDDHP